MKFSSFPTLIISSSLFKAVQTAGMKITSWTNGISKNSSLVGVTGLVVDVDAVAVVRPEDGAQ